MRHNGEYVWLDTGADKVWMLSDETRLLRYPDGEYRLEQQGAYHIETVGLNAGDVERLTDVLLGETVAY